MKLTTKLSLAVSVGVVVVLAAHAATRVHRDVQRYHDDVRKDHLILGRALSAAVEQIGAADAAGALELVDEVNRREADVAVRWIDPRAGAPLERAPTTDIDVPALPGLVASTFTTLE